MCHASLRAVCHASQQNGAVVRFEYGQDAIGEDATYDRRHTVTPLNPAAGRHPATLPLLAVHASIGDGTRALSGARATVADVSTPKVAPPTRLAGKDFKCGSLPPRAIRALRQFYRYPARPP